MIHNSRHPKEKKWQIEVLFATIFLFTSAALFLISLGFTNIKLGGSGAESKYAFKINIPEEEKYWFEQIGLLGGEEAYQDFKDKYLLYYPKDIHYISHIFGKELYKTEGFSGVTVCDNSFAYGCYHGVIVSALKERGLDIISDLNGECVKKDGPTETGCRHGVGHGLLEYLGHKQLLKALMICSSLQKVGLLGCTQGVLMEYNRPGMMDSATEFLGLRKLENESLVHEPCVSLPSEFLNSCYYEQSQWWLGVFQRDYKKVGLLCEGLEQEEYRRSCFLGVGVSAGQATGYDVKDTVEACDQMPEIEDQIDCRSAAAWVFEVNPKFKSLAPLLCDGMADEYMTLCLKNSIPPNEIELVG